MSNIIDISIINRKSVSLMILLIIVTGATAISTYEDHTNTLSNGWFNVREYGAVGDGVTDDTSAIQSAINDAQSYGKRGTIYFPRTTNGSNYRATGLVAIAPITIIADNKDQIAIQSVNNSKAIFTAKFSKEIIGMKITGVKFYGTNTATEDCVVLYNTAMFEIEDSEFSFCRIGISLMGNSRAGRISDNVFGTGNKYGIKMTAGSGNNIISSNFIDENLDYGIYSNTVKNIITGNLFQASDMNNNGGYHILLDTSADNNMISGNSFIYEIGHDSVAYRDYGSDNSLIGNHFGNGFSNEVIISSGAKGAVVLGNSNRKMVMTGTVTQYMYFNGTCIISSNSRGACI